MKKLIPFFTFPLLILVNNAILIFIQIVQGGEAQLYFASAFCETDTNGTWRSDPNDVFLWMALLRILIVVCLFSNQLIRSPHRWQPLVYGVFMAFLWVELFSLFIRTISNYSFLTFEFFFASSYYLWPLYVPIYLRWLWALFILGIQYGLLRKYQPVEVVWGPRVWFWMQPLAWSFIMWVVLRLWQQFILQPVG
ncbi:MAG TPA: hypothetical protein DCE41_32025 [Cytophagales bacterium]|nr:hypothetical protein [Cytophagales bacterium]HAA22246.1 hypothetical protein [Cytophagales bacterium]HAP63287.1 hypothetical protein [Cytophagales bacterium]